MGDNGKKALIGVVAVLAVLAVAWQVMNFVNVDKPVVTVRNAPVPPGQSMRDKEIAAQNKGNAESKAGDKGGDPLAGG